jgi:hypothetical protein
LRSINSAFPQKITANSGSRANPHTIKHYNYIISKQISKLFGEEVRADGNESQFFDVLNGIIKAYASFDPKRATRGGIESDILSGLSVFLDWAGSKPPDDAAGRRSTLLAVYNACDKDFLRTSAVIWADNRSYKNSEINKIVCKAVTQFLDTGQSAVRRDDIDCIIRQVQKENLEFPKIVPDAVPSGKGKGEKPPVPKT